MGKRKRRLRVRKNFIILIFVLILLAGGYIFLRYYEKDPAAPGPVSVINSEYITLENSDTTKYIAVVMYNNNVNINAVANQFYGNMAFWVYIFLANEDNQAVKTNPLDIPHGTILKLPIIPDLRINGNEINPAAVENARILADSILNTLPPISS